jgi:glutamate dehydrogenase
LDLTDNVVDGKIVKPKGVHCYDNDDPYLVVAADKGTANFSDTANQIAAEYNFWLGDAFASGGKHGYNHKDLQITSKGSWVSAELHLRSLRINPEGGFTCVGVGGMSGDVFGNFMLFEPNMKLIAAFSHAYIFVDPNPDCKASFIERSRLFKLPHAQWSDYNRNIISKGGGVFLRSDKEIPLTQEMKQALSITSQATTISPNDLIKAILKAPVDLMFQGGIGTYVQAESETKILDKTNESVRVNGKEIRAKSVVEGANLAFTQLGRIEYARHGGVINTDFIDNSGGVDCSDHEVNIKILLNNALADKVITMEERNSILKEATTDVIAAVLSDNLTQNLLISQEHQVSSEFTKVYADFMNHLEEIGMLSRQVEKLPDDATMRQMVKDKVGLTRPELAVLASYAKQHMKSLLKTIDLTKIPELEECLVWYFPTNISSNPKLLPYIAKHKLANEIIDNVISNFFVNTTGIIELYEAHVRGGHSLTSILLSFIEAQSSEHEGCGELCTHSH